MLMNRGEHRLTATLSRRMGHAVRSDTLAGAGVVNDSLGGVVATGADSIYSPARRLTNPASDQTQNFFSFVGIFENHLAILPRVFDYKIVEREGSSNDFCQRRRPRCGL